MLLLMQGSILLEISVSLFPSVSALGDLLLRSICHMVYFAWTQVMVVYAIAAHYSITMLLVWIQIRPRIQSLKYSDHLVPNQRSIYNEQFGEWSDRLRVTSKHLRPTEN